MSTDAAMLPRILAMLPETEAEWLARRLAASAAPMDYAARDAAVRRAMRYYEALPPTVAAKALERAYAAYVDGDGWADLQNGPPDGVDEHRRALFDLARANNDRDLGWRRIHDIAKPK